MRIDLSGKTAIITGSTAGIGLPTAKGLATAGAKVVVNGCTPEAVERAVKAVGTAVPGAEAASFAADLGNAGGCNALVAMRPNCEILVSEWTRFFEVNDMSGVRLSRAYLPAMIGRGWGRIVFVASESALNIPADMIHYGFTKTAQLSIARGLAKRAAGTGVTVNSVLPGPTLSEGVAEMLKDTMVAGQSFADAGEVFVKANRRQSSSARRARGKSPT